MSELNGLVPQINCPSCDNSISLTIAMTGGGYYLGFVCNKCGPISRETDYFPDLPSVRAALQKVRNGESIPEARQ